MSDRAISYITVMPDTKDGIQLFVEKVLSELEHRQAIPLLIKLTAMEKIIEGVKEGIKDAILQEADLTAEKTFTIDGHKIEKKSRTNYYYNTCPRHEALKSELKALEELMKTLPAEMADTETGEIIKPANKSYTEFISITLKKS
jgi:uncharacterized ParB-like nuclease family protein